MQGLITLDFGNTNPHAGLFQKHAGAWSFIKAVPFTELSLFINQLGMNPNNSQMVLCEVKEREEELMPFLKQGYLVTRVKDYWRGGRFAGMPVHYAKTLGEDRLIESYYCFKHYKVPTLLIDAGTYVTMDVVDHGGLQGGYILPGTSAYFSAFAQGELLKQIKIDVDFSSELPQKTMNAMRDGYVAFGALAREIVKERDLKQVILTGGSASLWETYFQNLRDIHVKIEPHFIHWSLQHWMTTQIELI